MTFFYNKRIVYYTGTVSYLGDKSFKLTSKK